MEQPTHSNSAPTSSIPSSSHIETTPKNSNVNPAFRYLGIPASWLNRKSIRLPSRNTAAFLIGSGSLTALYFYDRHQCKKIKQKYLNQVGHLSESLLPSSDLSSLGSLGWMPRKVNVYGARIPEDVDVDRGTQWFKRYVKPILVAAAIDYTIHNGTTPGALARKISDDIRDQRVISAAHQTKHSFEQQPSLAPGMPGYREWHAEQNKLEGGTLILGRTTLKEYLWGLKDGYKRKIPIDELDDDERFSKQLEGFGIFDIPTSSVAGEISEHGSEFSSADLPERTESYNETLQTQLDRHHDQSLSSSTPDLGLLNTSNQTASASRILNLFSKSTAAPTSYSMAPSTDQSTLVPDTTKTLEPTLIPPQPPLLLVPFDYPIGIKWWPLKIYRFFNQRHQVELGARTAMKLIESQTRPIKEPKNQEVGILNIDNDPSSDGCLIMKEEDLAAFDGHVELTGSEDLDFLAPQADLHLRRSYQKAAKKIIEERIYFRNELKDRLKIAQNLEDDDEKPANQNQLNESQLRLEAFQKEKKWNDLLKAWFIVRKGSGIAWDPDMALALKIFDSDQPSDNKDEHQ